MIQSLLQIRRRIRSIESTEKLTRAMEMISISKLRAAEDKLLKAREYFLRFQKTLNNVLTDFGPQVGPKVGPKAHPLLEAGDFQQKTVLCLITADTGLCGSYNYNIIRAAQDFISSRKSAQPIGLIAVGKRGLSFFKKSGFPIIGEYTEVYGRYSKELSDKIATNLIDMFLTRQADEVYVAYTRFETAARLKPTVEKILNIASTQAQGNPVSYLVEPDTNGVLDYLLPEFLLNKMRFILLNAFASEHAARGMAMGEATDNAKEMLEELVLLRNKVRQANITRDIIEVISAADALKG